MKFSSSAVAIAVASIATMSATTAPVSAYNIGGFDMFGRPVIINPRVVQGRGTGPACRPRSQNYGRTDRSAGDSVDRAFQDLTNELRQDSFRRQEQQRRRSRRSSPRNVGPVMNPWMQMQAPMLDEEQIRRQEEWVNRAFGLATDVAKGFASSPREVKEVDEAVRQSKEWADRIFGVAKDFSSGGTYASVRSEILQDDDKLFQVALDVPGVKDSDIDVSVEGTEENILVVRGKRGVKKDEEPMKFSKVFSLDKDADIEQISASLENGVLVVSVPRVYLEGTKPSQKIPVSQASGDDDGSAATAAGTNDQRFQLEFDLPGVIESNIDVVIEGDSDKTLTVTAVRELGKDSEGNPRTKEISKNYKIDSLVDTETIEATLSNGVLTISALKDKKKMEESVRKINITSNRESDNAPAEPSFESGADADSDASSEEDSTTNDTA